jgi:Fe-S cluster assembly iron-binding protein IscA
MAQEIYHRSEWGNPNEQWGNVYLNADLTNELYKRASEYENSWVTDQLLNGVGTKPSIILTPTAYEDGVLNSVKPAKTLGSELVTNGTFDTDLSGWTNSNNHWQWTSQGAYFPLISTHNPLTQILTNPVGVKLKITFTLNIVQGTVNFYYKNTSNSSVSTQYTESGTYTIETELVKQNTDINFSRYGGINTEFYLNNVSVKEVTEADFDFTRGSSATRVNELGLVQDVTDTDLPRINYKDGEGSLLLEPQSTNLVTYSEDYSQSVWSKFGVTESVSNIISPDGTQNASLITIATSTPYLGYIFSLTQGTTYTVSCFVKKGTNRWVRLANVSSSSTGAWFDLENGVVGTVNSISASIEDYGNGWYRIQNNFVAQSGNNTFFGLSDVDNNTSSSGIGKTAYIWGFQIEQQSYATSYIPTNGSTVTRLADVCNNSGSSELINSTEGVLYAEISALADDLTNRSISISDGSTNNRVNILYSNSTNQIRVIVVVGGSTKFDQNYNVTSITDIHKIAVKYKADDFALWVDGVERLTDTSGTIFAQDTLNELAFNIGGGILPFYGNVKCVAVFKEALSDTELQKLTTI